MKVLSNIKVAFATWIWSLISEQFNTFKKGIEQMVVDKIKSELEEKLTPAKIKEATYPTLHTSASGKFSLRIGKNFNSKDKLEISANGSFLKETDIFPDYEFRGVNSGSGLRYYNAGISFPSFWSCCNGGSQTKSSATISFDHKALGFLKALPGITQITLEDAYTLEFTKSPAANWGDLLPKIEQLLFEYLEEKETQKA